MKDFFGGEDLFGGGGGFPEGLEKILNIYKRLKNGGCSSCETSVKKEIGNLTESEHEEFNSMMAEMGRMEKLLKAFQKDREIMDSRRKLFWSKLEKRLQVESNLTIDNGIVFSVTCEKTDCE